MREHKEYLHLHFTAQVTRQEVKGYLWNSGWRRGWKIKNKKKETGAAWLLESLQGNRIK